MAKDKPFQGSPISESEPQKVAVAAAVQDPPAQQAPAPVAKKIEKGACVMYHVGLVEDAPFDSIDVPTLVIGGLRGKCVSVPKRTGRLQGDAHGNFTHIHNAYVGRLEKLFDIEYAAFVRYLDTHVFRKTSEYEVSQPDGTKKLMWRAEIESVNPAQTTALRGLHGEERIESETLAKYVWIVPCTVAGQMPQVQQPTVAEAREAGAFKEPPQQAA